MNLRIRAFLQFRKNSTFFLVAAVLFLGMGVSVPVLAATYTVCPSGCDFDTITNAVAVASSPDVINVQADYASTTETFSFNLPNGVTLDCQNSGSVIGTDDDQNPVHINSQSDNIFRNCIFSSVILENTNQSNVQILDNTWRGNSGITANSASNIVISGNTATGETGLRSVSINSAVDVTIASNTIMSYAGNGSTAGLRIDFSTSVQVTSNLIQDNTTTTNNNYDIIDIINGSFDIYFASNTVSEPYLTSFGSGMSVLQLAAHNVTIADNTFYMNGSGGGIGLNLNANIYSVSAIVRNNTYVLGPLCSFCNIIQPGAFTTNNIYVTSTYNLFVSYASSSANNTGHFVSGSGPSSNLFTFTEYDGFVGLNVTNDAVNFPPGTNAVIRKTNPLKTDDATSANDFEQVPYSAFLDVNGTRDIGAIPGVRGTSFNIDEAGTIDYSTVVATSTGSVFYHLRSNDTVNLATGDYGPIVLVASSTNVSLLSGVSIIGAGPSTVIHASSTGDAVFIDGITNSTFQDFTVSDAFSTATNTYTISRMQFSDGVTDYDDGASIGIPNAVIIVTSIPFGGSCTTTFYDASDFNVTNIVAGATDDWNLFMVDYATFKLTILAPDRFVPDAATVVGCAPGLITVEHEVSSIFTVSAGIYTYNSAAAALEGVSPKVGETNPPTLTKNLIIGANAGLKLDDVTNSLFSGVEITGNGVGLMLLGTSGNNAFVNSSLSGNTTVDVSGQASGSNRFLDTSFAATSTSITGSGLIDVRFTARAFVKDNGTSLPLSGITVQMDAANAASSTVLVTDLSGFTNFIQGGFPAFTLSSSSASELSGGFNPYVFQVSATSGYSAASVSVNLRIPEQTVTLSLVTAPLPATGPTPPAPGQGGGLLIPQNNFLSRQFIVPIFPESLSMHDLVKLPDDGNPVTQSDSTVYYLGADGRRHAFPNPSVYESWFCDFSKVRVVSSSVLASIPLGPNVTYRSGLRLVKFPSIPTVYVVQPNGMLRGIVDETMARKIAGDDWAKKVSDISEAFYIDYRFGSMLTLEESLNPAAFDRSSMYPSGSMLINGYSETLEKRASTCPSS
jgi:hypothetical protein